MQESTDSRDKPFARGRVETERETGRGTDVVWNMLHMTSGRGRGESLGTLLTSVDLIRSATVSTLRNKNATEDLGRTVTLEVRLRAMSGNYDRFGADDGQ